MFWLMLLVLKLMFGMVYLLCAAVIWLVLLPFRIALFPFRCFFSKPKKQARDDWDEWLAWIAVWW